MKMGERMKVSLDLEDVLVRNVDLFIDELNDFIEENCSTDERLSSEAIEGWRFKGLREEIAEIRGWDEDVLEKFMNGDKEGWPGFIPLTEKTWREQPEKFTEIENNTKTKVKNISKTVKDAGGELYIVTARENVDQILRDKISSLGINNYVEELIVKNKKDKLDFDVYIDDYPYLHSKLKNGVQIMIDRPWNKKEDLKSPHKRVKNLEEARKVIQDLG